MFALATLRTTREDSEDRIVPLPKQADPWWGDCVHTTGSGVPDRAIEFTNKYGEAWSPAEIACYFYAKPSMGCPHEVIDTDGAVYRIVDESMIPAHCGVQSWMRRVMLDGSWEDYCPPEMVRQWRKAWGRRWESPQHMFTGTNANWRYRGTELIPTRDRLYTGPQLEALCKRLAWSSRTYKIPHLSLTQPQRLLGHEDLNPFPTAKDGRADTKGGWDPGARRAVPRFDWAHVRARLMVQTSAQGDTRG